ncbi:MAG: GNAT family N-acetyltransferase [Rickettsiales bacterium]|nr:GNAT family N-acetyltransferase [Rickettsiales bacterium]
MSATLNIRPCNESDVSTLMFFIRSLAEYEKLLHEVTVDEETLRSAFFGPQPKAYAVLAEQAGTAVGFAVYFHNFSTFLGQQGLYVEDLFVLPDYRGQGYGKMILSWLARRALMDGCGRMEWWALDWNEPSISFYKNLGAMTMDEWTVFRITRDRMRQLADME